MASLSHSSIDGIFFLCFSAGLLTFAAALAESISAPCRIGSITAIRFSRAAFSLPGRLTISEPPRIPAAPLDRHPRGVMRMLAARIASGIPRASRSTTESVASGTISRGENAVPPTVSTTVMPSSSVHFLSSAAIISNSLGTTLLYLIFKPFSPAMAHTMEPPESALLPSKTLSLIVITAVLKLMLYSSVLCSFV